MERKILKVGDVIQFNGKRYRAEAAADKVRMLLKELAAK